MFPNAQDGSSTGVCSFSRVFERYLWQLGHARDYRTHSVSPHCAQRLHRQPRRRRADDLPSRCSVHGSRLHDSHPGQHLSIHGLPQLHPHGRPSLQV